MANKLYTIQETAVVWSDTTGDLALTLNNLAAGAGRQGAVKDWGALSTARATIFWWELVVQFATTPVVGEQVDVYWKSSDDNTHYDNDDGTGDIALSATDKLRNLKHLGTLVVDEAAPSVDMRITGLFADFNRYGMPVIHNKTADNLVASNDVSFFRIKPIPPEIQ